MPPPYTLHPTGNLDMSTLGAFQGVPFSPQPVKSDSGFFEKNLNKHVPLQGHLFTRVPELGDINQMNIGNCWFLAGLAAILNADDGPMIVQRMMRDNADGSVTVRIYDGKDIPMFLRMEKSVVWVVTRSKVWHSMGGAWVMMLEKAMTAFHKDGTFDPSDATYGRIEGNFSIYAFRALLGIEADYYRFGDRFDEDYFASMASEPTLHVFHRLMTGQLDPGKPTDQVAISEIFGSARSILGASCYPVWCNWLQADGSAVMMAWLGFVQTKHDRKAQVKKTEGVWPLKKTTTEEVSAPSVLRYEDFVKFMDEYEQKQSLKLPKLIRGAVVDWVRHNKVFGGKRGTGLYSAKQMEVFDFIREHADQGHPMTIDTRKYVGIARGLGHSAAEPVSKGLAGGHSYAVLGVSKDPAGRCYVKIYNPWGSVGRQYSFLLDEDPTKSIGNTLADTYVMNKPTPRFGDSSTGSRARQQESAAFWIELSDITKRFDGLSYCKTKPVVR